MQRATGTFARHNVTTNFADLLLEVVRKAKSRIADVIAAGLSGAKLSSVLGKRYARRLATDA